MTRKTEREEIGADLATVEALLGAVPEGDVLGRRSLTARRDILAQELATLTAQAQPSAHATIIAAGESDDALADAAEDLDGRALLPCGSSSPS